MDAHPLPTELVCSQPELKRIEKLVIQMDGIMNHFLKIILRKNKKLPDTEMHEFLFPEPPHQRPQVTSNLVQKNKYSLLSLPMSKKRLTTGTRQDNIIFQYMISYESGGRRSEHCCGLVYIRLNFN